MLRRPTAAEILPISVTAAKMIIIRPQIFTYALQAPTSIMLARVHNIVCRGPRGAFGDLARLNGLVGNWPRKERCRVPQNPPNIREIWLLKRISLVFAT
jgi:hypothetical protein